MNAPAISDDPAIRPLPTTSSGSAPKRWNVAALLR